MGDDGRALALRALDELRGACERLDAAQLDRLGEEIVRARRIACYACGREGLMLRALCMRLFHLGLDVHVVGDMTTPPLAAGDLLLVSAGPGDVVTVRALVGVARAAGARTLAVTAQPEGRVPHEADVVVVLPGQTMADDTGAAQSVLPMGSLFEAVELVAFDVVSILLRDRLGQAPEEMRSRHTNLE